jgi:hypothetical protein
MDMTWNDLSNAKYINSGDVTGGKRIPVTIKRIVVEAMNDGAKKPVVYFEEMDKGCVLNATRRKFLASLCGSPNVNDAIGLKLVLCEGTTQFQGEDRATIKFAMPQAAKAQHVAHALDDEIPFAPEWRA